MNTPHIDPQVQALVEDARQARTSAGYHAVMATILTHDNDGEIYDQVQRNVRCSHAQRGLRWARAAHFLINAHRGDLMRGPFDQIMAGIDEDEHSKIAAHLTQIGELEVAALVRKHSDTGSYFHQGDKSAYMGRTDFLAATGRQTVVQATSA